MRRCIGYVSAAPSQLIFSSSELTVIYPSSGYADVFIEDWNSGSFFGSPDSAFYNITVTKISSASVSLRGNTSGETVTLSWNNQGDETFSSTNTQHPTHTYYAEPISCPNLEEPLWYGTFLQENARAVAVPYKRRAFLAAGKPQPLFKDFFRPGTAVAR